MTYFFKK